MKKTICGLALGACTTLAQAQSLPTSSVDLYYAHTQEKVEDTAGHLIGPGLGFRATLGVSQPMLNLSYEVLRPKGQLGGIDYEDDIRNLRAGAGYRFVQRQDATLWARVEYVKYDITSTDTTFGVSGENTTDGWGAHLGGAFEGANHLGVYLEGGWLELSDASGYEATLGMRYQPDVLGTFIELRRSSLNSDPGNVETALNQARIGLRVAF